MEERSRRQKMEERSRDPSSTSVERAFAAAWLEAHPKRVLGRDDVLSAPDVRASVREVRYYDDRLRAWVVLEVDVVDAALDDWFESETLREEALP